MHRLNYAHAVQISNGEYMSDETIITEVLEENNDEVNVDGQEEVLEAAEAPKTEEVPKTEEKALDNKLSSKFAALTKKEKALKQRERDLERRLKELEARAQAPTEAAPKTEAQQESFERKFKKDPIKTMEELGYNYETITRMMLDDGKLPQDKQLQLLRDELKEEIESKYSKEVEDIKKQLREKEEKEKEASVQSQVETAKKTIVDFIDGAGDEYELIKTNEHYEAVWEVIQNHYNETEEVLDIREAADKIEGILLESAKKHLNLNKIKKLMETNSAPKSSDVSKKPATPTLTNSLSQSGQSAGGRRPAATREEQVAEAAKLLKYLEK